MEEKKKIVKKNRRKIGKSRGKCGKQGGNYIQVTNTPAVSYSGSRQFASIHLLQSLIQSSLLILNLIVINYLFSSLF